MDTRFVVRRLKAILSIGGFSALPFFPGITPVTGVPEFGLSAPFVTAALLVPLLLLARHYGLIGRRTVAR